MIFFALSPSPEFTGCRSTAEDSARTRQVATLVREKWQPMSIEPWNHNILFNRTTYAITIDS